MIDSLNSEAPTDPTHLPILLIELNPSFRTVCAHKAKISSTLEALMYSTVQDKGTTIHVSRVMTVTGRSKWNGTRILYKLTAFCPEFQNLANWFLITLLNMSPSKVK